MGKLLITGALGHIGSKLIREIDSSLFEEIILIDDLSTQRYVSLFNLPAEIRFRFIERDILKADLVNLLKGVDVVIHLAAITNAAGSFDIQEKVEMVNFEGTKRVAEACLVNNAKLIFLSTTSIYGTQKSIVDEDCSIDELQPQSPYAFSKLKSEQLLIKLGKENGLHFIICRFGTIFGDSIGMRFHTAVNKFIWQACNGEPLTIWKTAYDQLRPYLDLKDAIRAINFVIEQNLFDNSIYNVLTVNSSVHEITEAIKLHIPNLELVFVASQIMNQLSYEVSNKKIKKKGFVFTGDIDIAIFNSITLLKNMNHTVYKTKL